MPEPLLGCDCKINPVRKGICDSQTMRRRHKYNNGMSSVVPTHTWARPEHRPADQETGTSANEKTRTVSAAATGQQCELVAMSSHTLALPCMIMVVAMVSERCLGLRLR